MRIGVVGIGFVGGAVAHWFEARGQGDEVTRYDTHKGIGSPDVIRSAEVVFVCVPTPFHEDGRGYDDSAVEETLAFLVPSQIVVIKSTIVPGSTVRYQKRFPRLSILFNPEFLVAKTAQDDFLHPERQIVGFTPESRPLAERILGMLPTASYAKIMPAMEAELVKYFGNTFLATRVIFANQFFDLCRALGADYETVKAAAGADSRIGASHFNVLEGGYRGYGGACLPKDVAALLSFAESLKVQMSLLKEVQRINRKLLNGEH